MPEVEKKLGSSPEGLSQTEAQKRLTQYGPNEIEEKKTNPFLKFLTYFWGPIPWMIEAAVILSAVARHWPDFGIILLLLLANAVVGFWEEHQAGNAIAALKAKLAIKAPRPTRWEVDHPGGARACAGRCHPRASGRHRASGCAFAGRVDPIEVDQSALTGESLPATRKSGEGGVFRIDHSPRRNRRDGIRQPVRTPTFGKTAQLVQRRTPSAIFKKAVLKIGQLPDHPRGGSGGGDYCRRALSRRPDPHTLQFALVLTVAAIPVAMPTVLSVTMAVGARLFGQKKKAIVSKLVAIEELAGVDVLCADKTGTLTKNKLTLGDPFSVNNVPADQVILNAALASRSDNNDTIDLAVLGGLKDKEALKGYQAVHFQPFDAVHKRTEATVKDKEGKTFKVTKGRAAGDFGIVGQCRAGEACRREGIQRICGARLSFVGRGAGRGRRAMAVSWCVASVRPAARRCQGDHRDRACDGRKDQDGYGRCLGHRQGNRQKIRDGYKYPRRRRAGRHEA